jgi:hypothetical protein
MSAILEAALALKTARETEVAALEAMMALGGTSPTLEQIDAAMYAANVAIHARVVAEREYIRLTAPDTSFPRPFSVVEAESAPSMGKPHRCETCGVIHWSACPAGAEQQ